MLSMKSYEMVKRAKYKKCIPKDPKTKKLERASHKSIVYYTTKQLASKKAIVVHYGKIGFFFDFVRSDEDVFVEMHNCKLSEISKGMSRQYNLLKVDICGYVY